VSSQTPVRIPIARPLLGEEEAAAARRAILSGWVTQGPEVAAFEREFAAVVGAPHACAVSSCTTALHLALLALGVGPGNEVITERDPRVVCQRQRTGGNRSSAASDQPVMITAPPGSAGRTDEQRHAADEVAVRG